ncbi:hypothetical protein [Embleya hyalina]|uniref:Uncharacterized protein n=1 Tax=Embleya hyalina TaxID=516124 RepID=A0A401Z3Y5_9ACTN|nr:hypothetical protein [Embleya hyalina]GCE01563.1 hypothetical protein EHYA_09329 [Embleya hyalina]
MTPAQRLSTAREIDPGATDKTDAVFGHLIKCADAATASRVADLLRARGETRTWYSPRINQDRVFFDIKG